MAASSGVAGAGVLVHQEILSLCGLTGEVQESDGTEGPVRPCHRDRVRSASYDMRLGRAFHVTQREKKRWAPTSDVSLLEPGRSETLVIPPNQVVVVSTLEEIVLGDDMVGHLTLKQDILLEGLLMGSQSQVDAGYRGWIYPLLYNLTDSDVTLKLGQPVIRLELVRLPQSTDREYDGDYQEAPLSKALRKPIGSSLTELRKSVESERKRVNRIKWFAGAISVAAVAAPILYAVSTGFISKVEDSSTQITKVEDQIHSVKLEETEARLEHRVAKLECRVADQGKKKKDGSRRC
jgi:deoxycytidine triphosphate deaminase